jgi:hypothetical protein
MVTKAAVRGYVKTSVENPFATIEDAHLYVGLLAEALEEAQRTLHEDLAIAGHTGSTARHAEALMLANYKLNQMREHLRTSRRLLNDLRTIRRLFLGEREQAPR